MKKLLGLLAATGLVASTSSVVVACGNNALAATGSIEVDAEIVDGEGIVILAVTEDNITVTGTGNENWTISSIAIVANAENGLADTGILTLETAGFELALDGDDEIDLTKTETFSFSVNITLTSNLETEEEIENTILENVAITATISGVTTISAE